MRSFLECVLRAMKHARRCTCIIPVSGINEGKEGREIQRVHYTNKSSEVPEKGVEGRERKKERQNRLRRKRERDTRHPLMTPWNQVIFKQMQNQLHHQENCLTFARMREETGHNLLFLTLQNKLTTAENEDMKSLLQLLSPYQWTDSLPRCHGCSGVIFDRFILKLGQENERHTCWHSSE